MKKTATNFWFKSVLTPLKNGHLIKFEEDLHDLVRNTEFKAINTIFQNQRNKDINMINKNPLLFIPVDDLYRVGKDPYRKLMQESITKSYKKSNVTLFNNNNKEVKTFAPELKLHNRIEQINHRGAFVTLKDHKINFQNDPKCRIINPAKSEIGIICKYYLELITNKIREKTHVNQ